MGYFHGYTIVAATFVMRFVSVGTFYSVALLVTPIQIEFGVGKGVASLVPAVVGCIAFIAALASGYLQDKLSERGYGVRAVFLAGSALLGIGSICGSYANSFPVVVICQNLVGIGVGWTGYGCPGVCVQWFDKWKGTASSIANTGGGLGIVVYVMVIEMMLAEYHSGDVACNADVEGPSDACSEWRQTLRVIGVFSLSALGLASLFMRLPEVNEVTDHERGQATVKNNKNDGNQTDLRRPAYILQSRASFISNNVAMSIIKEFATDRTSVTGQSRNSIVDFIFDKNGHKIPAAHRLSLLSGLGALPNNFIAKSHKTFQVNEGSIGDLVEIEKENKEKGEDLLAKNEAKHEEDWSDDSSIKFENIDTEEIVNSTNHINTDSIAYDLTLSQVVRTKTFATISIWAVLSGFSYDTVFWFIPTSAEDAGISQSGAALALSLSGILLLVGTLTLGYIADVFGTLNAFIGSMFVASFAIIAWPFCTSTWSLVLITSFYGYFAAGYPLAIAVVTEAYAETAPHLLLTLIGLLHFLYAPGTLLGPIVCGVLAENVSFLAVGMTLAFVYLAGNLALLWIPSAADQTLQILGTSGKGICGSVTSITSLASFSKEHQSNSVNSTNTDA